MAATLLYRTPSAAIKRWNVTFCTRCRFSALTKQEKEPDVESVIKEVESMELTPMNVSSLYLDTYNPILKDLRHSLSDVNKRYVRSTISFFGWSNAAGKMAQHRINQLTQEIDDVSQQLTSFCHLVNTKSNANLDKLFQSIHALTDKLQNETVDKHKIIAELQEQQSLVIHMKEDIDALQVQFNSKTDNLMQVSLEFDDAKTKLETAQQTIQKLEADLTESTANQLEAVNTHSRYRKRMVFLLTLCTAMAAMMTALAAWYYMLSEDLQESQQAAVVAKEEAMNDAMKEKTELHAKIDELEQELNKAANRGLWSYIFGY